MHKQDSGLTLIELIIAMTITGILATIVVPSFLNNITRHHLEGAVEVTLSALKNTKAEAINRNARMALIFQPATVDTKHSTWCFGIATPDEEEDCDCNTDTACEAGSVVQSTDFPNISVQFNNNNKSSFSPLENATAQTITFAANSSHQDIIISTIGRIRTENIVGNE